MVCFVSATSGTFVADIVGHLRPSNSYMKVRDITRTCDSQVLLLVASEMPCKRRQKVLIKPSFIPAIFVKRNYKNVTEIKTPPVENNVIGVEDESSLESLLVKF